MNEKKNAKISKLDLEVARFIAEQGPLRTSTIAKYMKVKNKAIDPRHLRRICSRLEEAKLIRRKQILAGSSIAWPTASGLRVAGLTSKSKNVGSQPSMELLLHSIDVAEVRIVYEEYGGEWICEKRLIGEFVNHLPDGMVIYNGTKIIVEIDRTRKSNERLVNIMKTNAKAFSEGAVVDYWVTEELLKHVKSLRALLPESIQDDIRVFVLPEVIL